MGPAHVPIEAILPGRREGPGGPRLAGPVGRAGGGGGSGGGGGGGGRGGEAVGAVGGRRILPS